MESSLDHFTKKYASSRAIAVNDTIHADDEMYLFLTTMVGAHRARMLYFKLGCDLARTIKQIASWRFAGKTEQIKIMEFACGYGRNLRHIVQCFPPDNVFVSDIYQNAVKFCVEQFGVRGRPSVHHPRDLDWTERFDLIVVPSLFSHLPESTFSGWIAALHRLLTDDGILAFSVHGDHLRGLDPGMPESGILFVPESESSTLDKNEYGVSWVNEMFVREQILRATGHPLYSRTRRGFWNHQDFYVIAKDPSVDVSSFRYDYGLLAKFESLEAGSGRSFKLAGWAKDRDSTSAGGLRIDVYLGGRKIAESTATGHRPDIAQMWADEFIDIGFDFDVSLPARLRRDQMLVVEAVSSRQRECVYALSLGESLPDLGQESYDVLPLQAFRNRMSLLTNGGGKRWTQLWSRLRGA